MVGVDPAGRVGELGAGGELVPSQEPVLGGVGTDQKGLGRSSLVRVRGNLQQETRRNRNWSECAWEAAARGYAAKSYLRDGWEAGMGENLGNNFVGDKEGRSWGRNDEGREQEWAYGRTLLHLWDGRTYKMIHSDKPGSNGKGSCERSPGEADYRCLGLLRNAESSTAWRRQGRAAEGRGSNRRPVVGSTL